jgi:RNA polymerase sigma-70 factor (ECF subfamily)
MNVSFRVHRFALIDLAAVHRSPPYPSPPPFSPWNPAPGGILVRMSAVPDRPDRDSGPPDGSDPTPSWVDEVVDRVLAGSTEAFAELVRRFQVEVWKVAAAALHDVQRTEEIVQQAFVNAYLSLDTFRPGADFALWIKAVARNLIRQELRTRARHDRKLELYRVHLMSRSDDDAAAERRDDRRQAALADCRRGLAGEAQRVLELRYGKSWGFERIGVEIGRTVAATRQLLARIRATLRECIERRLTRAL